MIGRQQCDALLDHRAEFLAQGVGAGLFGMIDQPGGMLRIHGHVIQRASRPALDVSKLVIADIGDDPQQPGLERAASILVQVAISFDERFLRRILCSVAVAQDSVRQIEGEALVSQDQLVEGR